MEAASSSLSLERFTNQNDVTSKETLFVTHFYTTYVTNYRHLRSSEVLCSADW